MSQNPDHFNSLSPGTILRSPHASYTVVRVLGVGGFGITYLVETVVMLGNIPAKTHLAIKEHFISSMCSRGADGRSVEFSAPVEPTVKKSRQAFVKEARRVHDLGIDHANIVRINEVFEANNTAYYVMEYLDGETLEQYVMRRGALPYLEVESLIKPLAETMALLHKNHLTHYDIKPQNIILTLDHEKRIRPVLIDFGLAKHYDRHGDATSTAGVAGYSVGFAPPEQYAGLTNFTPEADVYALAATMLYCLTGEIPSDAFMFDIDEEAARIRALMPAQAAEGLIHALQMKRRDRTRDASLFTAETFSNSEIPANETQGENKELLNLGLTYASPENPLTVEQPYIEADNENEASSMLSPEKNPVTNAYIPPHKQYIAPPSKQKRKKSKIFTTLFIIVGSIVGFFFGNKLHVSSHDATEDVLDSCIVQDSAIEETVLVDSLPMSEEWRYHQTIDY